MLSAGLCSPECPLNHLGAFKAPAEAWVPPSVGLGYGLGIRTLTTSLLSCVSELDMLTRHGKAILWKMRWQVPRVQTRAGWEPHMGRTWLMSLAEQAAGEATRLLLQQKRCEALRGGCVSDLWVLG